MSRSRFEVFKDRPAVFRRPHLSDLPHLYDLCHRTGYLGGDASHVLSDPTMLGQYFVAPYVARAPEWCWVVEDEEGIVGYLVTTPDSRAHAAWMNEHWLPGVRRLYAPAKDGASDFESWLRGYLYEDASFPDFTDEYPAHLHIDFLPRAQGQGLGTKAIGLFQAQLRAEGVPGFHLGMAEKNTAGRFYEKLGLTRVRRDPGVIYYGWKSSSRAG